MEISTEEKLAALEYRGIQFARCECCRSVFVKHSHGRYCSDKCRIQSFRFRKARELFYNEIKNNLKKLKNYKRVDIMAGLVVEGYQQFEVCYNNAHVFRGNVVEIQRKILEFIKNECKTNQ